MEQLQWLILAGILSKNDTDLSKLESHILKQYHKCRKRYQKVTLLYLAV